ncbi:hypothetical protein FB567DRAFT_590613 [Paraphoma chrysanthemicola]|uniref:Uncharacterized protein n=1 Tax=Paraphoma chrysanthemicola TaxID=798071 RepID=A0A8K0RC75_9PLEO|nr:hypothetical protein FB567DRAFT_590613 [Paraphoma chrysanthemicola]
MNFASFAFFTDPVLPLPLDVRLNIYTGRDCKGFDRCGTNIFGKRDQQDGARTVQVAPIVAIDLDDDIWRAIPVGGFDDELPDLGPAVGIEVQAEQLI